MHVDQSYTCILFLYSRPTRSLRTKYPEQQQTYPRQAIIQIKHIYSGERDKCSALVTRNNKIRLLEQKVIIMIKLLV